MGKLTGEKHITKLSDILLAIRSQQVAVTVCADRQRGIRSAAQVLLTVIAKDPDAVARALES